jgi:hypothetical protein
MTFKTIEMLGRRFGRLLVVARDGSDACAARWKCVCDCGSICTTRGTALRGGVQSCGCLTRERSREKGKNATHGLSKTIEHMTWLGMRNRCNNPRQPKYENYGGRGITVCERWDSFENFLADMGKRPPGMTIDRIDNNGNYEPSNCRWADRQTQSSNRRSNIYVRLGDERVTLAEATRRLGICPQKTAEQRVGRGWDPLRAVTQPARKITRRITALASQG